MTYHLYIGDRSFSSWSLRGWLMFEKFDIPVQAHLVGLYSGTMAADLAELAPAQLVPAMRMPDGVVVGDTLAMAETLAERHPGMWPEESAARAMARWLVAEMHSGFASLRGECPMMLRHAWEGFQPSPQTRADLARLEELWTLAKKRYGSDNSPWLFDAYSLADVFFAPVAARIATYNLPVADPAGAYVDAHLADKAFRAWRHEGQTVHYDPLPYALDLPQKPWPGPA